ncbi:hypothetical protein GLYMA_12G046066v4 [Glycine max]|nr:hypothetical protein GLYMA_12G046066v4 [Glycine max]
MLMEAFSVQSPFPPICHVEKPLRNLLSHMLTFPISPGSAKTITATAEGISEKTDSKDDNLVFVACATGRVGSRSVRELIKLGFRVRAGVQNAQRAGALVQSVEQLKLDGASGGGASPAVEKLEILKCDLEKPDTIGYASKVICSIVASEKGGFHITAPFQFPKDYQVTKNLIEAGNKSFHYVLVCLLYVLVYLS